jgi:hypothetical protein
MPLGIKLGTAVIGLAMFTTAVLPDRQTAKVFDVVFKGVRGILATAMGTGLKV